MKMKSIISFVFLLLAIINVVDLATSQFPAEPVYRCRKTGNYSTRTDYARNLNVAINKVGMQDKVSGNFYNSSWGGNEAAYALALCSDIGSKWGANCSQCVTKLINAQIKYCPDQKEGVMWSLNCMFRYSDRKIFGVLDDWVWIFLPEKGSTSGSVAVFDKNINELATKLQKEASEGGSARKTAEGVINKPPNIVYGVMQCTPDLSKELCSKCLQSIIMSHHPCCSGKTAARMFSPNCYFSYSLEYYSKWKSLEALSTGYALQSKDNEKWTIITVE